MADYAIGDVQGCYDSLQYLLDKLHFNKHQDRLWLVGDLVNRGPNSLAVLRFVKNLPVRPQICLGNHDLHLLSLVYSTHHSQPYDPSLQPVLEAEDCAELCAWLNQQSMLCFDPTLNIVMVHAGIAPQWTLTEAQTYAKELEAVLQGPDCALFLQSMYANQPNQWSADLSGMPRMRLICNYLTRMRFCFADGSLDFQYKGTLDSAPPELYPWYAVPQRRNIPVDLVFGHWSALAGQCTQPNLYALDTGCVWGGTLTALRLQDRQIISVPAQEKRR